MKTEKGDKDFEITSHWAETTKKVSILHGLELYGAGALLVHQSVLESRVRPLVSQEVVRQLDVDLLWTHNDHFVEETNRHLKQVIKYWQNLHCSKRRKINLQELGHTCNELGNCDFKEEDGAEDGFSTLGKVEDQPGGDWSHVQVVVQPDTIHKPNLENSHLMIFCQYLRRGR